MRNEATVYFICFRSLISKTSRKIITWSIKLDRGNETVVRIRVAYFEAFCTNYIYGGKCATTSE